LFWIPQMFILENYAFRMRYNIKKATEALVNSSKIIIDKSNESYKLSNICVVVGNDIIHVDNPKNQTTRGTPQDSDGKWWQMFEAARRSYIEIISYAAKLCPVNIIFCPSNHDLVLGFALTDAIYCYFYNDENVNIIYNTSENLYKNKNQCLLFY